MQQLQEQGDPLLQRVGSQLGAQLLGGFLELVETLRCQVLQPFGEGLFDLVAGLPEIALHFAADLLDAALDLVADLLQLVYHVARQILGGVDRVVHHARHLVAGVRHLVHRRLRGVLGLVGRVLDSVLHLVRRVLDVSEDAHVLSSSMYGRPSRLESCG